MSELVGSIAVWKRRGAVWPMLAMFVASLIASPLLWRGPSDLIWLALLVTLGWFVWPAMAAVGQGSAVVGVNRPWSKGTVAFEGEQIRASLATRSFTFSIAEVESAWIEPTPLKTRRAVIAFRDGWVIQAVLPQAEAEELITKVGFDRARAIHIPVGAANAKTGARAVSAMFTVLFALLALPLLALGVGALSMLELGPMVIGAVVLVLAAACSYGAWLMLAATLGSTLTLGTDGVLVRRMFRSFYFPFSHLLDVVPKQRELLLDRGDIPRWSLPVSGPIESAMLASLVKNARQRAIASAPDRQLGMLDRAGRDLATWKKEVRALTTDSGYRDPGVTTDELVRIATGAMEPPDRRVAAAVVLARVADDSEKKKVRIAADSCADEAMKRALTIALEEAEIDERALERATQRRKA